MYKTVRLASLTYMVFARFFALTAGLAYATGVKTKLKTASIRTDNMDILVKVFFFIKLNFAGKGLK